MLKSEDIMQITVNKKEFDNLILLINNTANERDRRVYLSQVARTYGRGGESYVKGIANIAYSTLHAGASEINSEPLKDGRIRKEGGGRKTADGQEEIIMQVIPEIIDGYEYGNPDKANDHHIGKAMSLRKMADLLKQQYSIVINYVSLGKILKKMGYTKLVNQKENQVGTPDPDRDEQFKFILKTQKEYLDAGDPVISVDTKKKENIGNFKNNGSEYRKSKEARRTWDHDFQIPELGKVSPYGVYVVNDNTGFINLGTDHDTSEFAVESIKRWWLAIGEKNFKNKKRIYITCDGGGSNGSRRKGWKTGLQKLADYTGMEIQVSHYPPGTSKWNKVEHRLFCYISKNWQGKPLIDIETVVYLIASTTTKTGLKVSCMVDKNKYEAGLKVTEEELDDVNLFPCEILGKWNYVIKPHSKN